MYYFNPYAIPPITAAIIIIAFGTFVWLKKIRSQTNLSWFFLCLSMFIWLIGDGLIFSTHDTRHAEFFSKIVYVGVSGIPVTNLIFCHRLSKTALSKLTIALLGLWFLVSQFFVFKTNLAVNGLYSYFWGSYPKAGSGHTLYLILWTIIFSLSLLILHRTFRRLKKGSRERGRLIFTFYAFLAGGILGSLDFVQKYGIEFYPIGYFAVPLIVGLISIGIIKHNLMDISVALKQSLVYSAVIGILTAIYLVLVIIIERCFMGVIGYNSLPISLLLTFTIALLFSPIRNRIQVLIDRLFLGKAPKEIVRENELLRHEVERSERLRAASTLALGLAHEIKNPLTTIKTFSEHLPQKCNDKEFISKFSKLIPSEVERINRIVHRLLNFSKPSPPKFQKTNLHALIKDIVELMSNDFLKYHITVDETYEDSNLTLCIDPGQIKQVLLNLLLNAKEAMAKGGNLHIDTKIIPMDSLEITITDDGCGIPPEHMKDLFTPFFSTKEGGTGLGLSICHQIIKNHGGTIIAESTLKSGTTFKIRIPLQKHQT